MRAVGQSSAIPKASAASSDRTIGVYADDVGWMGGFRPTIAANAAIA